MGGQVPMSGWQADLLGRQYGGAFWHDAEYRVTIAYDWENTSYALVMSDSVDTVIYNRVFTTEQAEQLVALVHTDETADDEGLGLSRELHWRIGDDYNEVDLNILALTAIADWIEDSKR